MDPHSIPKQITTFEFKLIGILTIKQFVYIMISLGFALIMYYGIPIRPINTILGVLIFILGFLFSVVKYNERNMDSWIYNLFKRIFSPAQFVYDRKIHSDPENNNISSLTLPINSTLYQDAQVKLNKYIKLQETKSQYINIDNTTHKENNNKKEGVEKAALEINQNYIQNNDIPFLSGIIKNKKNIALPNIIVYIKQNNNIVRILKTNIHGIFATFQSLKNGKYDIEIQDPEKRYFFDTIKIIIDSQGVKPLSIFSKELL